MARSISNRKPGKVYSFLSCISEDEDEQMDIALDLDPTQ